MTILKTLQDFLLKYPGMELRPIAEVLTDHTAETAGSYALAPSGNGKTRTDVVGNRTFENNYVFYAREATLTETDRQENSDFLESLQEWLDEQNENLPELPGKYEAESIEVSNGMLFDIGEDGTGLYQVQIKLTLTKWR